MMHSNPLIQKWEEIHGKKEKPKVIKADEFEGEVTLTQVENAFKKWSSSTSVASNLTSPSVATSNTGITKASPIKCFDNPSGNDAFLQIAEKIKNGTALVKTVSAEVDHCGLFSYGKRITFEVYDYENP
jgi:hypothetical protein